MASERQPRWKRRAYNIAALREEARRVLPRPVFDFVDGGAGDEHTLRRNVSAFDSVALYPRPIGGSASRDLSTTLFGRRLSMPLIVPPTGLAGLLWPEGEAASARAATKAGSVYCLSHGSICTLEELAETGVEPRWFQTYIYTDRGLTHEMAERAAAAGYEALIVTIDTQILGNRERDIRNGFVIPPRFSGGEIANMAFKLRWLFRMRRTIPKITFGNYRRPRRRQRPHHPPRANVDAAGSGYAVGRHRCAACRVERAAPAQGRAPPRRRRRSGGERRGRGVRLQPRRAPARRRCERLRRAASRGGRGGRPRRGAARRRHQAGHPHRQGAGAGCGLLHDRQGAVLGPHSGRRGRRGPRLRHLPPRARPHHGGSAVSPISRRSDRMCWPDPARRHESLQRKRRPLCRETGPTTPPRTAPKSVSNPLPRRAARRAQSPPATAIGSARDAPSTSDRARGHASLMGYVGRTSLRDRRGRPGPRRAPPR